MHAITMRKSGTVLYMHSDPLMGFNRIVVVGASAGGIEALQSLASQLRPDFAAPICVVLHISPESPGMLPTILRSAGPLPAEQASDGIRLRPGRFYTAPPDHHLLVEPGVLRLTKGPKENRFRPAIDPLFRSAACVYGPATVGVLLSGGLDDGTAGMQTIKSLGGVTILQSDPLVPSMTASAAAHVRIDHCAPIAELGSLLAQIVRQPVHEVASAAVPASLEVEVNIAKEQNAIDAGVESLGRPSSIACPECQGVLLQLEKGGIVRFRCHTGHAYSSETLIASIEEGVETSLWRAVRSLEEARMLLKQLADHMSTHGGARAQKLIEQATAAGEDADAVRRLVMNRRALQTSAAGGDE